MEIVRMGELTVSSARDAELVAIGLGSCIGLAVVDRGGCVAGLAHIVLPDSQGVNGPAAKFANTVIPEMMARLRRLGASLARCEAVLAGGARMFSLSGGLDIGARNEARVREELARAGIVMSAAATGGNRGRTVRVIVGTGEVLVQEAGGESVALLGPRRTEARPSRAIRQLKLSGAER
jgi:chemotaxis protein CheD